MVVGDVYNRYFKVVGGDLGQALVKQLADQHEYLLKLEGLAHSLGATKVHTWQNSGEFAGFAFPAGTDLSEENWIWNSAGFYIPRRMEMADLWKLIRRCGKSSVPKDVLEQFGLKTRKWLTTKTTEFGCSLTGFYSKDLWWVEVPTRGYGPEIMAEARKAKANGEQSDPINMLWEPPSDWEEVTVGKYLDEWDYHYRLEKQIE